MEWFNEKDIEDQLRDLPKFQMSNGAYERIALNLRKATRPAHSKNSRRRTMNIILTSIVAFAGVSAVGIVAINIPFDHSMSREVTGTETVQEHTKQQIPKSRFDYSKFLSFTPLLPSDTLGLKSDGGAVNVNHATTGLTPGNYASFDIEYGALKSDKWFPIQEQATSSSTPTFKESQASILISTSFQKNGVHYLVSKVMSDTAHTKSYFWVAYVKDHINYNLGFSSVFSTTEAEEVATHINELDTQKPSDVTIFTNSASEAMKAIHFKPILPATALSGFHQYRLISTIKRVHNSFPLNTIVIRQGHQVSLFLRRLGKRLGQNRFSRNPSKRPLMDNLRILWIHPTRGRASCGSTRTLPSYLK